MKKFSVLGFLLAIFSVFLFVNNASADTGFAGGDGSEDDPFIIENSDNLEALHNDITSGSSAGKYYALAADVESTHVLGTKNGICYGFRGTFDGCGHTVTLNINAAEGSNGVGGFIGVTFGSAVIKNLVIEGSITCTGGTNTYDSCKVGAVVARNDGLVINCINRATVKGIMTNEGTEYGHISVGGLVGQTDGINAECIGLVINCVNEGKVISDDKQITTTDDIPSTDLGGIVGRGFYGSISHNFNFGELEYLGTRPEEHHGFSNIIGFDLLSTSSDNYYVAQEGIPNDPTGTVIDASKYSSTANDGAVQMLNSYIASNTTYTGLLNFELIDGKIGFHHHTYSTTYSYDEDYHWKAATCTHNAKAELGEHNYVNGKCNVCGVDKEVFELPLVKEETKGYIDITYTTTNEYYDIIYDIIIRIDEATSIAEVNDLKEELITSINNRNTLKTRRNEAKQFIDDNYDYEANKDLIDLTKQSIDNAKTIDEIDSIKASLAVLVSSGAVACNHTPVIITLIILLIIVTSLLVFSILWFIVFKKTFSDLIRKTNKE